MEELLRRAEAGDSDSQLKLACAYLLGENCEKDEAEGLKWMLAAAEGGNATAMRNGTDVRRWNRCGARFAAGGSLGNRCGKAQ